MEHTENTIDTPHQVEDTALKVAMQFFADELLPYFNIEGEVDHIGPTEVVHLQLQKLFQDFNLVMKDGSWIHFEFQSTDKGVEDLKRFRVYEALTSYQNKIDMRTYVLFSGEIENPISEFTSGFNTYRVQPIIMKGHRVQEVFENITNKLDNNIPLNKDDLVPLILCPLMDGDLSQKERISIGFRILRQAETTCDDIDKMEAVLFAMATKFLENVDMQQVKEELKMTELGRLVYNDGKLEGAIEIATNLFLKGISFEIVRESISGLSDEKLQEIYKETIVVKECE